MDHDALFKALSEPSRFEIFRLLCNCRDPPTVGEVHRCCDPPLDQSVVSRHLGKLRDSGIVESSRRGQSVHYHADARGLARRLRELADALENSPCCCAPPAGTRETRKKKKKGKQRK